MDLYELRTGFKDWSPILSIPEMTALSRAEGWPLCMRTFLDIEMDRLVDSWKFKEYF